MPPRLGVSQIGAFGATYRAIDLRCVTVKQGSIRTNAYGQTVDDAISALEHGMAGMIYRLLWLALDEDPTLLPLQLDDTKMPTALAFCAEFQASRNHSFGG
jgi:hypothetical protein